MSPLLGLEREAPVARRRGIGEPGTEADVDAVAAVLLRDHRRGLLVAYPREDARRHLDDGDADAELAGGGRDFEADQAAADHREVPRRLELRRERIGMGFGAQVVDAGRAERQRRDLAHHRAGGDDEGVIGQAPARRGDHFPRGPVDRGASRVEHKRHAVAGHALGAGDRGVGGACLAEQHRLRQRWALIGFRRLVGDEGHLGARIATLGLDGREYAGRPASDDDDVPHCHCGLTREARSACPRYSRRRWR